MAQPPPPGRIETTPRPGEVFRTDVTPYSLYYEPHFGQGQLRFSRAAELRAEPSKTARVTGRTTPSGADDPPAAIHEWLYVTNEAGRVHVTKRREAIVIALGRATGLLNGKGGRDTTVPHPEGAVTEALAFEKGDEVELLTGCEQVIRFRGAVYQVYGCGDYQGTCKWHGKTPSYDPHDGSFEVLSLPDVTPWLDVSVGEERGWIPAGHEAIRWKIVAPCGTR